MVMECEWAVNSMAILRGEKRNKKIRVEQLYPPLNFDMVINHGDYNREREGGGKMYWRQKTPLLFLPLPLQAIAKKQQRSRGRR